eukprot:2678926-Karenia_brevis.AAC.1
MDNIGCHSCGRLRCWSSSPTCHSGWTRDKHVCGPSVPQSGCTSCGRQCHESNADVRCTFFLCERGHLHWNASEQQLMDTQAGTQGAVPLFSQ